MSQLTSSTIKFLQSRRKPDQDFRLKSEMLEPKAEITPILKDSPVNITSSTQAPPSFKEGKKVFSNSLTSQRNPVELKQSETDLFATLPIDPNEAKQWLHMNVVEKEKLEWMKELPPVKNAPGPEEPYAARFDFQGRCSLIISVVIIYGIS